MRRAPSAAFRKKTAKKFASRPLSPLRRAKKRAESRGRSVKSAVGEALPPSPTLRAPPSEPLRRAPPSELLRLTRLAPPPARGLSPPPQKRGLPRIARRDIRYTRSREGSGERQAASLNAEGGNRFPTLP